MNSKMTLNETVREALGIALIQIMDSKSFSDITIQEIATVAGVSRSSFYRNFSTKEDLLHSYITSIYRTFFSSSEFVRCLTVPTQVRNFLEPRFRFIKEHSHIYRALHRNNLLYPFFQQAEDDLLLLLCGQDESLSTYHRAMISGSCAGVIQCWIERDFQEDPEAMAMCFSDLCQYPLLIKELMQKQTG